MSEQTSISANLEAELAELSKQIEEKRTQLEASRGTVVEHKEAMREVVGKELHGEGYQPASSVVVPAATTPATSSSPVVATTPSYLDRLDAQSVAIINELVTGLPQYGLKKTIDKAKSFSPFMLDAFHDALIDKLYDELKRNNMIK